MVDAAYDHIVAILAIGALFVGTVVILPNANFANLMVLDQQQMRNTALTLFNTMLLDAGEPSNWGSIR